MSAPITPERFDRIIWTADGIGARINTSADFVRDTLAKMPGTPVKQINGRYCAVESKLLEFFESTPADPTVTQPNR